MTTVALIGMACFVVGYLTGRIDLTVALLRERQTTVQPGFFAKTSANRQQRDAGAQPLAPVEIDERKVVSRIETDTLQKVTDIQLGKQVVASDDINAAANKLSSLKRS